MMKSLVLIPITAAAVLLSSAALTQASPDPAKVEGGQFKVEPHHTLVQFSINHLGFNNFFGTFPGASGLLSFDPKAPETAKLDVSLPVDALSTTNTDLDGELKGPEWFDSQKFPVIRFVSTSIAKTGPRTVRINGTLTLHGVSKPFSLDATLGGSGNNPMSKAYTVGFSATGTLKRTDFGISKFVPMVGDEVTLRISAAFEKSN